MNNKIFVRVILFIFIAMSGNHPFITFFNLLEPPRVLLVFIILLLFIYFNKKKKEIDTNFISYLLLFIILLTIQYFTISELKIGVILFWCLPILLPYLLQVCISENIKLIPELLSVITFVIKVSFIFWLPTAILKILSIDIMKYIPSEILFPDNLDIIFNSHMVIHNFRTSLLEYDSYYIIRNCGMFWEPGAFAGIIIMSILLFLSNIKNISIKYQKKYILWFCLGLLSTQSTTGLLVLPLLVIFYFGIKNYHQSRMSKILYIVVPIVVIIFIVMFNAVPTLNAKITEQIENVTNQTGDWKYTRFGNMMLLFYVIITNPYIGVGFDPLHYANIVGLVFRDVNINALGNGMMMFIAKTGIPFFVIFCIYLFRNLKRLYSNKAHYAFYALIILIATLQGEDWMRYPFVYSFIFFKSNTIS